MKGKSLRPLRHGWLILWLFAFSSGTQAESPSEAQWSQVSALKGIPASVLAKTPQAFVFFDPNCPYTARLSNNDKVLFGSLGVDIRKVIWIPITYMRPDSVEKAAQLLRAGSYEMLQKNFKEFNFARGAGSLSGVKETQHERQDLATSKAVLMSVLRIHATPSILYRERSGAIRVQSGLPSIAPGRPRQVGGKTVEGMRPYSSN